MNVKQFSEACERNREPILAVLETALADKKKVLEIGSGTGQHAVYFARHLPHLSWQTSDLQNNHASIAAWQEEAGLSNVLPPFELNVGGEWPEQAFDAVFTANTCHIMAWPEVVAMFAGVSRALAVGGLFILYGPFNYGGQFTSPSNQRFNEYLLAQAPHMGIRDFEEIQRLAEKEHMTLLSDHEMPANNRLLIFSKSS
jgi:cyclopropane fatty-acyl-phospholipid synthase-like methyltransferase